MLLDFKGIIKNLDMKEIFLLPFKKEIKKGRLKKINVIQLFISIVSQMAPLFFVKDMFKDMIKIPGMQKLVFNKLVKNRKKFVIDLILNGIKPAGNKQRR